MKITREFKIYKFKKGQIVHLDLVYEIHGLIPMDAYKQADPADKNNDSGESLEFIKNVEIRIEVKIV
jgi:hypothetical protein